MKITFKDLMQQIKLILSIISQRKIIAQRIDYLSIAYKKLVCH